MTSPNGKMGDVLAGVLGNVLFHTRKASLFDTLRDRDEIRESHQACLPVRNSPFW